MKPPEDPSGDFSGIRGFPSRRLLHTVVHCCLSRGAHPMEYDVSQSQFHVGDSALAAPSRLRKKAISLYLEPDVYERLVVLSRSTHVPQQWYLRQGVDWALEQYTKQAPAK